MLLYMYVMQEKKVDKNTFAEKSEDVWSAMQEVRTLQGHEISRTNFAKTGTFLTSQHCKIKFPYLCANLSDSAELDLATILL